MKIQKKIIAQRLAPYRSACVSVMIGIFAILLVAIISAVGKEMISREMDGLGIIRIA